MKIKFCFNLLCFLDQLNIEINFKIQAQGILREVDFNARRPKQFRLQTTRHWYPRSEPAFFRDNSDTSHGHLSAL